MQRVWPFKLPLQGGFRKTLKVPQSKGAMSPTAKTSVSPDWLATGRDVESIFNTPGMTTSTVAFSAVMDPRLQ